MATLTFYLFNTAVTTQSMTFNPTTIGVKTCTTNLNGAGDVPKNIAASFTITGIPVGASTLVLGNVAGAGTLSALALVAEPDLIRKVETSNTSTWGLGGAITSFAGMFSSSSSLLAVPNAIPTTVTNLANMFNDCTSFIGTDASGAIANWDCANVTNMSGMFNNCTNFNAPIGNWNVGNVTTFSSMFNNCANFNQTLNWTATDGLDMSNMFGNCLLFNNGAITPMTWSTPVVTNMNSMFAGCSVFNADISSFTTNSVTDMGSMFSGCSAFNKDISFWITTNVVDMSSMFNGALLFSFCVKFWPTPAVGCVFTNMFSSPSVYATAYFPTTPGYDVTPTAPARAYFGQPRPERYPCFMKGTQILCLRAEEEVYRPVQDLRKGDLVKTYRNGYLPIHMIGTSRLSNPGDEVRTTNRLYKCSKELYPALFEDLYITGCHSILVPALTNDQWENTKDMLGNVYITDNHFRLMACLDEKAQPFQRDAMIDIYHIALENEDYYMNYGVYANGLLVETCSKRYLTELSNMRIIGEDEACYDAPSVNVFSELSSFIQC